MGAENPTRRIEQGNVVNATNADLRRMSLFPFVDRLPNLRHDLASHRNRSSFQVQEIEIQPPLSQREPPKISLINDREPRTDRRELKGRLTQVYEKDLPSRSLIRRDQEIQTPYEGSETKSFWGKLRDSYFRPRP